MSADTDKTADKLPTNIPGFETVRFNADGLVPAIAQQYDTGEVLMMAWMNADTLAETIRTGRACYWSRSRQAFWRKGRRSDSSLTPRRTANCSILNSTSLA